VGRDHARGMKMLQCRTKDRSINRDSLRAVDLGGVGKAGLCSLEFVCVVSKHRTLTRTRQTVALANLKFRPVQVRLKESQKSAKHVQNATVEINFSFPFQITLAAELERPRQTINLLT